MLQGKRGEHMEESVIGQDLRGFAQSIGIADIGFCSGEPFEGYAIFASNRGNQYRTGFDVDASGMSEDHYVPDRHLPGVKSMIAIALPYAMDFQTPDVMTKKEGVRVAKASIFEDYHHLVEKQCRKVIAYIKEMYDEESIAYCDMGPLNDKSVMLRTGLVKIGRSSLLLHPKFGTRFYIGYILTTLDIGMDGIPLKTKEDYEALYHPFCARCGRCAAACPNKAINDQGLLTSSRCVSYLTQSKEWEETLPDGLTLDGYVYGCDTCQRVCPLNGMKLEAYEHEAIILEWYESDAFDSLSNREFKTVYNGSSAGWIGKKRFVRNARWNRNHIIDRKEE